jgi:hypothetical protein
MRQEMLTARDQGRDEFAMPEQPTELEVNEFKLVQPPLRRLVSTRPGRHQRAQVLRAQSRACLPWLLVAQLKILRPDYFCHDVKKICN